VSSAAFAFDVDSARGAKSKAGPSSLRVSQPGDSYELEADRVAETVSRGGRVSAWSLGTAGFGTIARQPAAPDAGPAPQAQGTSTTDILAKLAEAFMATKAGQDVQNAIKGDEAVKSATDVLTTPGGIVVAGSAAVGAVSALAATHQPLPLQIPKIPLDKIQPGLSLKITYEGPVNHPTAASLTLSFEGKAPAKKPAQTESEKYRAETARIREDQERFRAGLKVQGGPTPEESAEQRAFDQWQMRRLSAIAGFGGKAPLPLIAPGSSAQTPDTQSEGEKREEIGVQRKAESNTVVTNSIGIDEVIHSAGRPLDRETRHFMETRIGFDFSKVRVHTDARAADSARSIGALAYTVGDNMVFAAGRYAPQTTAGRRLLAHELAHTIQQHRESYVAKRWRQRNLPRTSEKGVRESPDRTRLDGQAGPPIGLIPISQALSNLQGVQARWAQRILSRGPVRFRVPTTADLKLLFKSGQVPESALKDSIQQALTRMASEKRLKTTDSVSQIMAKVFPVPGVFDETAYENAVDVSDRSEVYQTVLDANTKVTGADQPKLKAIMGDSADLITQSVADEADLSSVFGTKKNRAKNNYVKAKAALLRAANHIDSSVTTDYNLDDPEVGVGGWATFADQHIHLRASVTKVTDADKAKVVIIHEASHLADPSIDDKGYYGSGGFEGMSEDDKVTNAADYEEVPMRILGKSKYKDANGKYIDFKPASKAPQTFEQRVQRRASEYLRKAWDAAVNIEIFIKELREENLAGKHTKFTTNLRSILEISKLMHLTVHQQPSATASINQVDVVVAESIARAALLMLKNSKTINVPPDPYALHLPQIGEATKPNFPSIMDEKLELKPMPMLGPNPSIGTTLVTPEDAATQRVIEDSIKSVGLALGSYDEDKKVMDWLVAHSK
jgi:hypothetical protein